MENKEGFRYTYSAAQRQEVENIRKKYLPKEEDKMDQLRRLHAVPAQKAQAAALVIGILGALILGVGMSLCLSEFGSVLGRLAMVLSIPLGIMGLTLAAFAYPVYNRILTRERRRIAPEILQLTDELMK